MQSPQPIPIEQTADSDRIEECGLPDETAPVRRRHLELKPRPTRNPHFGRESEQPPGLYCFDPPKVQCLPRHHRLGIPSASSHPWSTDREVAFGPSVLRVQRPVHGASGYSVGGARLPQATVIASLATDAPTITK